HRDVAMNLNNLAGVVQRRGNVAEAEALYRRAIAIKEQALGPDHADLALALNNLALLLADQGHSSEAEPLYQRALGLIAPALGKEHPNLTGVRETYTALLRQMNRDPTH